MLARLNKSFPYLNLLILVGFLLRTNLSLLEKILIIFGYYFFYEYNIISRNYGISALMMIILVYRYMRDPERLTRLAIILFILAQTHLFSLLFSMAFVLTSFLLKENLLSIKTKGNCLRPALMPR